MTKSREPKVFPLCALVSDQGHLLALEVWTIGGVDRKGRELDPEPERVAYPTEELAIEAAKALGPRAFHTRAFLLDPEGRGRKKLVRWAKK